MKNPILLTSLLLLCSALPAAAGGSICTTDKSGATVGGQRFDRKTDVFWTGGPDLSGVGLADGVYYFQVTDVAGARLLSADAIDQRKVLVQGGVVSAYLAHTHAARPGGPSGAWLVQLAPFFDSKSAGSEYKLWLTPEEQYDFAGTGFFGFNAAASHCELFKVEKGAQDSQTIFRGHKFYDANENGVWDVLDPLEVPIPGWRVEIYREGFLQDVTYTDVNGAYQFIRNLNGLEYSFREVAPGGFIGDNVPGAIWLAKTARAFDRSATAPVVEVPDFGNVSFELRPGSGRTKGFWHNQNGKNLLAGGDPAWRDALTTWNGSPLCLRRNISSYDPNVSIFTPLPLPATFDAAHADFAAWIVGDQANGHAGFMLSTQVAAAILSRRFGFMQFDAYIDRRQDGILVSFDAMVTEVQTHLLCPPEAGETGPMDPEQALRAMILMCVNEFGTINNSGDPSSTQTVFGPRSGPSLFNSPY